MLNAFSPEVADRMSEAVSQAWSRLEKEGLLNGDTRAVAKSKLARAIVAAAEQGVLEKDKMIAFALAHYAKQGEELRDGDS